MVSVVIVNWNAGVQILECVNSVVEFGGEYVDDIIVVDNNSSDNSAKLVADIPQVTLLSSSENLGFGKACNFGAARSRSPFILFLNPDARLFETTIEKVISFFQGTGNEPVGICGVQLIDENGHVARSCANLPSTWSLIVHAVGLDRVIPSIGHRLRNWDHSSTCEVGQVIGAFFFVRRNLFDALGGFDEDFFVYYEEVDFSCRAKHLGWSSFYLAEVQAFHSGGGTSCQVKAKRLFYSLRSRIIYSFKHFNLFGALIIVTASLFIEPFSRSVVALLRSSWTSFKETWSGYRMLVQWLPSWILKGTTR